MPTGKGWDHARSRGHSPAPELANCHNGAPKLKGCSRDTGLETVAAIPGETVSSPHKRESRRGHSATSPVVSVQEEYLKSSWQPDTESIEGALLERSAGTGLHGRMQRILRVHMDGQSSAVNIEGLPECRTRITERRYRVPYIIVVNPPLEQPNARYEGVPLVAIEILSPEDRFQDLLEKYRLYASLGVRDILQLDPATRTTFVYKDGSLTAGHVRSLEFADGGRLDLPTERLLARLQRCSNHDR
jgi:Uma2 family endonuclease